jgi:hypothetical protein
VQAEFRLRRFKNGERAGRTTEVKQATAAALLQLFGAVTAR